MTAPARRELVEALRQRYAAATREEKVSILSEFTSVSGLHRKVCVRPATSYAGDVSAGRLRRWKRLRPKLSLQNARATAEAIVSIPNVFNLDVVT
jgi:hypothetical protein